MKTYDFNKKDRSAIAEFIFSKETDVLIKSDTMDVIITLHKHRIIDDKKQRELVAAVNLQHIGIVGEISGILLSNISDEQGSGIMDEYYGKTPKTP